MTPIDFAALMQRELDANASTKGDWCTWRPLAVEAFNELTHHANKLIAAMNKRDAAKVTEHAADLGNIAMKIAETFGADSAEVAR